MSTAQFQLNDFISKVKSEGLARVNRYEMEIIAPPNIASLELSRKVSLFCEVSNFPPLLLNVKPFKIFGPSYQRPISSEYGGDGLSATFHVDRSMSIKRFFDDWLEYIVDRNSFTVAYQNEYTTKIKIKQLDEANNVTYEIELLDAFPRNINLMELNNSAQNQTQRLNVLFSYRYWRRSDIPANLRQTAVVPKVNFDTVPYVPAVKNTPFSEALESVNNNDGSVDFSSSATGGIVAP